MGCDLSVFCFRGFFFKGAVILGVWRRGFTRSSFCVPLLVTWESAGLQQSPFMSRSGGQASLPSVSDAAVVNSPQALLSAQAWTGKGLLTSWLLTAFISSVPCRSSPCPCSSACHQNPWLKRVTGFRDLTMEVASSPCCIPCLDGGWVHALRSVGGICPWQLPPSPFFPLFH